MRPARRESRGGNNVASLRSKSREFAMQMLFQWDMSQQDPRKLQAKFWKSAKGTDSTRSFANQLFEGAAGDVVVLDEIIGKHAENWKFERLAAIDRAILRLAIYELRATDTPPKVVLNEAVELAKKFSSEDSGAFVNGILDAFRRTMAAP
jgi:N utilization substance protein B